MEKGLLMFTLAMGCFWLILDDFYGGKRLTKLVIKITPDVKSPLEKVEESVSTYKDKVDKNSENYLNRSDTLYGQFKEKLQDPYERIY